MAGSETDGARAVRVTPEEVRRLCEFLYRRTGMLFNDNKRYYIDRRLIERIAATGSASFQAYFAMLRSDVDHEIEHLINAFTVNETYFYREEHQLRCMTVGSPRQRYPSEDSREERSASGRFLARPARSPIRSRSG